VKSDGKTIARFATGILALATGALFAAAGCSRSSKTPGNAAMPQTALQATRAGYTGSAVCAECHAAESTTHSVSRHAATLRVMSRKNLGVLAPPDGAIPQTNFAIATQKDRFRVALANAPERGDTLDLAFGSGRTGMTYVAILGRDSLAELRMSYFPKDGKWYVTPGQEHLRDQKLGKIHKGEFTRRCVFCHAVAVPDNALVSDKRLLGVGCEACHGAGEEHVAAMRSGKKENLRLERLTRLSAPQKNELCTRCHTIGQSVSELEMNAAADATRRFPFFGLQKSKCFAANKESLSCLNCHNPHSNASPDPKTYEAACLKCHAAPAPAPTPSQVFTRGKPCPINARTGCINCHMPLGKILPGSQIPTQTRDHFIRIHGDTPRPAKA
jgi:hypothetical protein